MKRMTQTEWGGLILSIVFLVSGFVWLVWPREMVFVHSREIFAFPVSAIHTSTKSESQVYGVIAMLLGVGLGAMAVYRAGCSGPDSASQ